MAVDLEDGARLLERALPEVDPVHQAAVAHAIQTLRNDALHGRRRPAGARAQAPSLVGRARRRTRCGSCSRRARRTSHRRSAAGAVLRLVRVLSAFGGRATLDPPRSGTLQAAPPSGCRRSPISASTSSTCRRSRPIGEVNRKGPNNTLNPAPNDPGSPWAIGVAPRWPRRRPSRSRHDRGLRRLRGAGPQARHGSRPRPRAAMRARPSVGEGAPEWFTVKSDGSIAYAENPPKKYQDIYPINFDRGLDGRCTRRCCGSSGTGCRTASASSGSTTRTPSRCRSGSG